MKVALEARQARRPLVEGFESRHVLTLGQSPDENDLTELRLPPTELFFGIIAYGLHRCQKQPSTNPAALAWLNRVGTGTCSCNRGRSAR